MDETTKAYIAGFLDGDGSIFFQLIKYDNYKYGFRVRASICFYQKENNKRILMLLKEHIKAGYIRDRKDGMYDYTITAVEKVRELLKLLKPYVILKSKHIDLGLQILKMLDTKPSPEEFLKIAQFVDEFATLNYSKKKTRNTESVKSYFNSMGIITPVETEKEISR